MNVLQYSPDQSPIGQQFSNEYNYNIQTSPSNSTSSDGSQRLTEFVDQALSMDNWMGNGEFPDIGEDVKHFVEPTNNTKEVVAFHHLPRNVCPTICAVCGDRATGYHYEVPSCNGCKTFFRRTVLSQRKYECMRGGKCFDVLPKEKRCSCRCCRFSKCVEVGMNPFAIQTPNGLETNAVVSKIVGKRKVSDDKSCIPSTSKMMVPTEILTIDNSIDRIIDGLVYLEIKCDDFRSCAFNPNSDAYCELSRIVDQHSMISLADKLGPMPNWPLLPLPHKEIKAHFKSGSTEPISKERKNWFVYDILTSVEYAKTFMFMHNIAKSDRILLLKAVVLKLMVLHQSYYSYANNFADILHPDGTSPPFHRPHKDDDEHHPRPPCGRSHEEIRTEMTAAIRSFMMYKPDRKEYVLFKAITLCNSSIEGLSQHARDIVSAEKEKFSNALMKYCLASRGAQGPAQYASILALSNQLETRQKNQKDFHLMLKILRRERKGPVHKLVDDIMEEV